ncbi:phage tail sheath family protein [Variovorax sp. GB1P17]|uniref:phage tail sheath family protein n=1 Tax=Variovorax sp. GB1P17 TaxID=3443740 RepID=UPI003F475051
MAGAYKTPGVYIVEKNAFPNSVVEVATAVPAFIGYTQIADNKGGSLTGKPWRVTSMSEFVSCYGGPPEDQFEFVKNANATAPSDFSSAGDGYVLQRENGKPDTSRYYLHHCMRLFFQNGGGPCYVVSVGGYTDSGVQVAPLQGGIDLLLTEQEPTMVVIPDAMTLPQADCIALQQHALAHCGSQTKSRFAILDISDGYRERTDPRGDCIAAFRDGVGTNFLQYSAAYYPWLNTSIVQATDLGFTSFVDMAKVKALLLAEAGGSAAPKALQDILAQVGDDARDPKAKTYLSDDALHKALLSVSPTYASILQAIQRKLNLLPPAAAMAGVYTLVDNSRGVWKAPANVGLNSVVSPAVAITSDEQSDLNITPTGKSINAIRTFIGEGTLVWGARTLDGNSLDWRYISVRRTMLMLEESLRLATKAYVFEPNVANTWVTIRSMASNFLTGIWKRGGLAGAKPEDAFSVIVGLNETMTPEDVLEGILRVTVLVALSRPAEFIEITFQQQMQKS